MATEHEKYQVELEGLTARITELEAVNAELARTARVKDDLLATMGHELRTPLNAVLSLSRVLQEQLGEVLTERQQESFRVINASGQHLLELINDILDLSKLQAGKMMLKFEPVAIEQLCAVSLDIVREQAEQKDLRLTLRVDAEVKTIQADPLRLKQILVNLLSNAVKFTPEHGAVGVEVLSNPAHDCVLFAVWDTGIGIAAADLPNLFKPFVQIENNLRQTQMGTGLGLALSQRLARQHGGDIYVESAFGAGSRFTLELPWGAADLPATVADLPATVADLPATVADAAAPQPHTANSANNTHRRLILLAEDNEANIFAISEYLDLYNIPVVVARTGPDALELARSEHPGLILMDINLPRLDGLEVIRRIRSIEGYATLPIAVITALSADNERVRAAGGDHYLGKPLDLDKLDRLLDQYFGNP